MEFFCFLTPTENQIKIQYLVKRFRYVHKDDSKAIDALERILWYSYPVVYPDCNDVVGSSRRQAQRVIDARKKKKYRYHKRIKEMLDSYDELFFYTFTFRDDVLQSTKDSTRHSYMQRWLNEYCFDYVANEDFGARTGRQHFHAVVALRDDCPIVPWSYGFSKAKKIHIADDDRSTYRLSGYLLKIVNHGGKLGTGKSFSKKKPKTVDNLPF